MITFSKPRTFNGRKTIDAMIDGNQLGPMLYIRQIFKNQPTYSVLNEYYASTRPPRRVTEVIATDLTLREAKRVAAEWLEAIS